MNGSHLLRALGPLWRPWWRAGRESFDAMESVAARRRTGPFLLLAFALVGWVLYVPAHELLHAAGCLATGGQVEELQIQPAYGGLLLERVIPFVTAGGEYAGRLTRFDTGGSDVTYLVTVAAPFALSLLAFPLLRLAQRRGRAIPAALAAVLLVAVLVSVPGDYYEMGSILVSAGLGATTDLPAERLDALRHDDLLALAAEFTSRFPDHRAAWAGAVLVSAAVGFVLASLTLAASAWLAGPRPTPPISAVQRAAPASGAR